MKYKSLKIITSLLFLFLLSFLFFNRIINKRNIALIERKNSSNELSSTSNTDENKIKVLTMKYEDNHYEKSQNLKNTIIRLPMEFNYNWQNVKNLDERNDKLVKNYLESFEKTKKFSESEGLELLFVQNLNDSKAISTDENLSILIDKIKNAESLNYYTDEDGFNLELLMSFTDLNETIYPEWKFMNISYKASIENIDKDFKFKGSKLDEFRKLFIPSEDTLNYDIINQYIERYYNEGFDSYVLFFNQIDENYIETIKIADNNIYYKLMYDPI